MLGEERVFEEALMRRGFEESSPGLSGRIISGALKNGSAGQKSILRSLRDIFSAFPIPSPALALPLLLVVGIAAGYFYPADSTVPLPDGTQVAELIYYDEGFYE